MKKILGRFRRFLAGLRMLRRHRIPLTRHNVRAVWTQTDPLWNMASAVFDGLTDVEIEEFLNALLDL